MTPTMDEVVTAYLDCRKGKRNTESAIRFELRLARNLCQLHDELASGQYRIGPSQCFVVTKPKPREVWAAAFRDRIVHHVMYNRIAPAFHASFSAGSCACIPGRGTLYGAKRLERQVRSVTQNWSRRAFYLKMDLSNFFVSIHRPTLFGMLEPKLGTGWTRSITEQILFHDPLPTVDVRSSPELMALVPSHKSLFHAQEGCGLPIGNLSSQFFANVYLNALDQFVEHRIKPRGYIRYVDDFILLHESTEWLNEAKARIEAFLASRLRAALNPTKTVLQPIDRGVDFVGQVVKPWRRVLRGRMRPAAIHRISTADDAVARRRSANSYLGLMRQCKAYRERTDIARRMLRYGHPVDSKFTRTFAHPGDTQCDI